MSDDGGATGRTNPGRTNLGRINEPTQNVGSESYCPTCDRSYEIELDSCPDDGTALVRFEEQPDDLIGRVIDDRFEILESLGAGGMGMVYRATQRSVGRDVAVKIIGRGRGRDRATTKRFLREARLTSSLTHPNIIVVHDVGQDPDGFLYIAMELIAGETLSAVLAREGKLSLERTLEVSSQLCDALAAAHAKNIVHRDLKPSNIMLLGDVGGDVVKVLDFGIAKSLSGGTTTELTDSNQILGTPSYIAPEMLGGLESDGRADLYALGCLIYKMVSGTEPLPATTVSAALARHLHDTPPRLDTDDRLADLVARLLAKTPDERPASPSEVKAVLEEIARSDEGRPTGDSLDAAPRSTGADVGETRAGRSGARWGRVAALALALAVVGAAALGLVALRDRPSDSPSPGESAAGGIDDGGADSTRALDGGSEEGALARPAPPGERPDDAGAGTEPDVDNVVLRFVTRPAGARVELPDGRSATTPTTMEVPRGDQPIVVTVLLDGYRRLEHKLTPTRDREVKLTMRRARRGSRAGADERGAGAGSGSGSGSGSGTGSGSGASEPPEIEFRVPEPTP